ncbi:MAG: hypothetical protein A2612_02005 [Candidatus Moranbacteria bacterium RIFOXYD1_FULL_44_12]|nr:MAG: hypothetical protein A2612_02005 [Candidatus Moranbacteria bacterium RIFOXYD1_FULL_44_12]
MPNLQTPLSQVSFIEKKYLPKLEQLGIKSVRDFLYFFPHRYDDFSKITKIAEIKEGETATVEGKITDIQSIRTWKRKMAITEALIQDKSGSARVLWFNQPYIIQNIKKDSSVRMSGKVSWDKKGLYLSSPAYENANRVPTNTGRIVPVYPETRGITSRWMRNISSKAILFWDSFTFSKFVGK